MEFISLKDNNPELAKEWHPTKNNNLKPSMVSPGSDRVVWWLGTCGHEFEQRIANRKLLERNQDLVIENLKLNNTINKFENSLIESNKYISNPAFRELFREQLEYLQELKGSDK